MNLFTATELLVGITTLLNGLFIIITGDVRKRIHQMIIVLSFATSLWGFSNAMVGFSGTPENAMLWWKIAHLGGFYTAVFILHLVFLVTGVKRMKFLIFAYVQAGLAELCLVFNLFDVKMSYSFAPYYRIIPRGITYPITLLLWIIVGTYACFLIYTYFRRSEGQTRLRYKLLWIALMCGYCGGATHLITVFFTDFFPFGNFSIWFFPIMTAYAVLRHQLLEIEVIIKKTLVFAGLFASALAIFILPTLVIQEFIVAKMSLAGRLAGLSISTALIVLVLKPLENFLIRITDRFLFQKKYDYKSLLKTFTTEVLTVLDLNRLTRLTVYKLADIMKMVSCGVLLFNEERDAYTLVASVGIKEKGISLGRENTLASFMERTRAYLSIRQEGKDSPLPENIKRDMNTLKVDLAIPLTLHDRMIGILTFGKKKSDEPYNQDDIDILLPLARTLSIAISNAELFDELSKTQAEAAQREKMAVIGTLSAGINHEICNPLGIVRGQCEAFMLNLKDGFYKDKTKEQLLDKAMDIMRKTIKEVDRATAVTKRLSSFAMPIKKIKLDEVNINDEINEVMMLVGHELKLEKIDLIKDIPPDLPDIVADRKQIEEIFFNLIRNAGQAIGERGRITVKGRMTYNNRVMIEIEDTGHGVPEDKLEQIFNPFYTTKEPGKGTGLGLFIVRQIVEKNKGKISVRSKVGTGTTFTLEFPAAVKVEV